MRRKNIRLGLILLIVLGMGITPIIPQAKADPWSDWYSGAVGDVPEVLMHWDWTITSTPVSGYESYLWPSWQTVIESEQEALVNEDYEIHFNTYSQTSYMGYIELASKSIIEDATDMTVKARFGVRYSYSQIKTVGSIELYDLTTQNVAWSEPIQSSGIKDNWYWTTLPEREVSLLSSHDYIIRLKAKDAWLYQRVEVAWEYFEVWFYGPYMHNLLHLGHSWREEPYQMIYECKVKSSFGFRGGELDDMLRSHIPYPDQDQTHTGWSPCYLHEFRSEPSDALEGDDWFATNMPGWTGYTDSNEIEEGLDGFEEVEVFTKDPHLLQAGITYWVQTRYQVWKTGSVTITLEAELGNEADTRAMMSWPAFPVAWLELEEDTYYHSYKSYKTGHPPPPPPFSATPSNLTDTYAINYVENFDLFEVHLVGVYPYYLKAVTRLKVVDTESLEQFQIQKKVAALEALNSLSPEACIPATITFSDIVSQEDIENLVERYGLQVSRFRFTATDGSEIVRGQGTSYDGKSIPIGDLKSFIEGYDLLGFQSIDVFLNADAITPLSTETCVFTIDFSSYLTTIRAGLNICEFQEVSWYTEEPSWYLSQWK